MSAIVKARAILVLLWLVCAFTAPILIFMMLMQALFGATNRAQSMADAFDQCGNALFGGDPTVTISSRTGDGVILGYRWALILAPVIDFFFGAGHCAFYATLNKVKS